MGDSAIPKGAEITHKSKIGLPIVNFLILISCIFSGAFWVSSWKESVDYKVENVEIKIEEVNQDIKENKIKLAEYGAGQQELKIGQARIEIHLIHIIDTMEGNK